MTYTLLGTGRQLPERVVTNDEIEHTSTGFSRARAGRSLHDWVLSHAGVATRHVVAPGEGTSDLALGAVRNALDNAGVGVDEVDLIVLTTFTSDCRLPSSVSLLAQALGSGARCLQLETACTGFLDGLLVATSLMSTAGYRTAVVVSAEAMSAVVDEESFLCRTIFGDGAGAAVVRDIGESPYGIEAIRSHTDASHCEWTWAPGGGTKYPVTAEVLADRSQYLRLDHRAIYRFAVDRMVDGTHEVLAAIDRTVDDVDLFVPHQTGANIIADAAEQLKIPARKVVTCLDHTGNVSGASVAIALDEANRGGMLHDGERVVLSVVGGGMAWGAVSLVWREPGRGA